MLLSFTSTNGILHTIILLTAKYQPVFIPKVTKITKTKPLLVKQRLRLYYWLRTHLVKMRKLRKVDKKTIEANLYFLTIFTCSKFSRWSIFSFSGSNYAIRKIQRCRTCLLKSLLDHSKTSWQSIIHLFVRN